MRLLYFLLFSLLNFFPANAKELAVIWDSTYSNQQQINDIILLPDGQLVAVGTAKNKANKKEGILLFLDPMTGVIEQSIPFPKSAWNSEFKSIAQADDGSFYIVGYAETSKKKQEGWILQVDELGIKINEWEVGETGNSELTNIAWLGDNTGLIAGYKNKSKSGNIWLLKIKDGKVIKKKEIGEGGYKDIKGMVANTDGSVWISGNTDKKLKKGNVWLLRTNADFILEKTQVIDKNNWHEVNSVSGDYFGNVLLSGNSQSIIKNVWLAEVNELGNTLKYLPKGRKNQLSTYAYKSPYGISWISTYDQPEIMDPDWLQPSLTSFKDKLLEKDALLIPQKEFFRITRILRNHQGQYLLAGNMSNTNEFRLVAIKKEEKISTKSTSKLESSDPTFILSDTDGSRCLSPNERGYIEFTLTNSGNSNFIDGLVSVSLDNPVEGLDIQKTAFIPFIPQGKSLDIKLKVVGKANLVVGVTKANIKVSQQTTKLLSLSQEVESIICQKGQLVKARWKKPDVMNIGGRSIRTKDSYLEMTLDIETATSRILKAEDIKIYKSGILAADEKNGERVLSEPLEEGVNLAYRFNYTIRQLEKGPNVIYVKINEYQTDSITVYYEPRKPNLHVLAIGPTYNNLEYTAKDARDFVTAVTENINTNFFEEIYIDTLLQKENTETNDIRRAFEKLKNKYDEQNRIDRIDRDDYLMIFISGHGLKHKGQFRLVSSDYNSDYISTTTVNYERDIIGFLNEIDCKKIAFIDACLSGGITGTKAISEDDLSNALLLANKSAPGMAAFASCSDEEQSYENKVWQNGVFTEAILEAISGKSVRLNDGTLLEISQDKENGKEVISIGEMYQFLQVRVPDLLKNLKLGLKQNPILSNEELDMNLPLFILK